MRVELYEYDPGWPVAFGVERNRVAAALGDRAVVVEHVGSTSVPGLAAKPIIDIVVAVPDAVDEAAYVPALEADGYQFILREPDWFDHRLLRRESPRVNLHVFTVGCSEIEQMTGFRDWLRTHVDDREQYERAKRGLATHDWNVVQDYADAKTDIVAAIKRRAGLVP